MDYYRLNFNYKKILFMRNWNRVKPIKNLLFIAFAFINLWGCGYTTSSVFVPAGRASIFVENFVNKIDVTKETSDSKAYYAYIPGMEVDITRGVIDKFIFDGNYEVKDAKSAYFSLKGQLVDFKRDPLRYDVNYNVIEYRISIIVDIELHDLKEGRIVWREKGFAGESTYRTTGQFAKSESDAVKKAVSDLTRRIVERAVENW